jgi:hypothetical protein
MPLDNQSSIWATKRWPGSRNRRECVATIWIIGRVMFTRPQTRIADRPVGALLA